MFNRKVIELLTPAGGAGRKPSTNADLDAAPAPAFDRHFRFDKLRSATARFNWSAAGRWTVHCDKV